MITPGNDESVGGWQHPPLSGHGSWWGVMQLHQGIIKKMDFLMPRADHCAGAPSSATSAFSCTSLSPTPIMQRPHPGGDSIDGDQLLPHPPQLLRLRDPVQCELAAAAGADFDASGQVVQAFCITATAPAPRVSNCTPLQHLQPSSMHSTMRRWGATPCPPCLGCAPPSWASASPASASLPFSSTRNR